MSNRDDRVFPFRLLVGCKAGGPKFNVVGLPRERRQAHVHKRLGLLVDPAALIVQALQAKRVEDLDFVLILEINAAVAAPLSTSIWHEGCAKFDVQQEILEFLLRNRGDAQEMPL